MSGPRILVTGGTGFLGSHVVAELERRGYDVARTGRRHHDLTKIDETEDLFDAVRPDVVIHLAGEVGGIGANRANPGRFWFANTAIGMNVLELSRIWGIDKLVITGTVCAYPKHANVPFLEDELFDGYPEETNAPYGIAKRSLLVGAQAYREQYGLNAIYLLPVNLYGPGDNYDPETSHVIPALIRKMLDARDKGLDSVTLWGDGSPTREFLFVRDAARAIADATERYDGREPVNVGAGREITMVSLARLVAELCEYEGGIVWDVGKPNGQPRRCLDVSRAREAFGFEATTTLRDGLEETIASYQYGAP